MGERTGREAVRRPERTADTAPDRARDRTAEVRRRAASRVLGTHDVADVPVGAATPPARLWRGAPDRHEREARTVGPALARRAPAAGRPAAVDRPPGLVARRAPRPDPGLGGGRTLSVVERQRFEPSLGVDLTDVRVHDGLAAKRAAAERRAHAFTFGNHVVLGYTGQHGGPGPRAAVLAHELVHVRQQAVPSRLGGGGSARGPPAAPGGHVTCAPLGVQCWEAGDLVPGFVSSAARAVADAGSAAVGAVAEAGEAAFDWVLDGVRSAARALPGYSLVAQVIGRDPITGDAVVVERSGLVDLLLTYGPFGPAVSAVLETAQVIGQVFDTISAGLEANRLTRQRVVDDIAAAFREFTLRNGIAANLAIIRRYVDAFLTDLRTFIGQIADRVIEIVRAVVVDLAEPLLESETIKPVWDLTKQVLHNDPLRGVPVEAPTVEILAGFLRLIGKQDALEQMRERGTLQETADWLDTQVETFAGLVGQLGALFSNAWAAIQPANLPHLLDTLPALASQAFALIQGVASFAATVILKVLELVKTALLGWLSQYAHEVPGFHLITVIIGRNPFTDEVVPRTAENLIKGFITLLPGGEATYAGLAESGVITEAATRIESEMTRLGITLELVTTTFLGVWNAVTLESLLTPVETFRRIVGLFGDPISRIFEFIRVVIEVVITLVLRLMSFPTELLGSIVSNTLAAIEDIKRDPVGFLVNILQALKAGFLAFFDHIGTYLLEGLTAWLFRGLGQIGITIPTQWSLASALDLVLQVLGLSTELLWRKLGEHIGEERVAQIREAIGMLTGAWAFIRDVQERGLAAIWDYVQSQLSGLWDTVLSMAREWVMTRVIEAVTARLISMLDPTGVMAVINGAIAFFDAVQSAIEYIREILEIINMYVMTFAAVAAGNIEPGAQMIERGLAAAIPVAIGFLANQVGLGNIPAKIVEIIQSLRQMVEQAIDWLIAQALRLGQAALNALGLGSARAGEPVPQPGAEPGVLVIDEPVPEAGTTHHLRADGPGHTLVLHTDPIPLTRMPDPDGTLAPLITRYTQARATYDAALAQRSQDLAARRTTDAADLRLRQSRAEIDAVVELLVAAIRGTSTATDPGASAPNIGLVERHGEHPTRIRGPANSRIRSDELIWQTESEHVLPFATGRSMWRALRLVPTLRGEVEDEEQTTIVIYFRAARIKTPVDNEISRAAEAAGRAVGRAFQRRLEVVEELGTGADADAVPRFIDAVEQALIPARERAVERTCSAIEVENGETEAGHNRTNSQRRGGESPVPGEAAVRAAAEAQYQDLVRLLREAIDRELEGE